MALSSTRSEPGHRKNTSGSVQTARPPLFVRLDRKALEIPASWKKPRRIFVNSMSDLFHDAVPAEFVHDVWAAMQSTPQHTYQVLTKRPDRMASITSSLPVLKNVWLERALRARNMSIASMISARCAPQSDLSRLSRYWGQSLMWICLKYIGPSSGARAARGRGPCSRIGSTKSR